MSKIRDSARGEDCVALLHKCNRDNSTTVFAHAPVPHRAGMRNNDHAGGYVCSNCHDRLDGREQWLCAETKGEAWFRIVAITQQKLIEKGLIIIKG